MRLLLANIPILAAGLLYAKAEMTWYHQGSTLLSFMLLVGFGLGSCLVVLISYHFARIPLLALLRSKKQQRDL